MGRQEGGLVRGLIVWCATQFQEAHSGLWETRRKHVTI